MQNKMSERYLTSYRSRNHEIRSAPGCTDLLLNYYVLMSRPRITGSVPFRENRLMKSQYFSKKFVTNFQKIDPINWFENNCVFWKNIEILLTGSIEPCLCIRPAARAREKVFQINTFLALVFWISFSRKIKGQKIAFISCLEKISNSNKRTKHLCSYFELSFLFSLIRKEFQNNFPEFFTWKRLYLDLFYVRKYLWFHYNVDI